MEAVKHPFIVDLLYAFQVSYVAFDDLVLKKKLLPDEGKVVPDSGVPEWR